MKWEVRPPRICEGFFITAIMIYRSKQAQNFTVLPNQIFSDLNNGLAIGIMAYLLSRPDNWVTYKQQLYKHFSEGRQRIDKAFDELQQKRYIVGVQKLDANGKFSGYEWVVYDLPVVAENRLTENRQSTNRQSETRQLINTDITNTDLNKEGKNKPTVDDFLAYALEVMPNVSKDEVRIKYHTWVDQGWCVVRDKGKKVEPIVNWKSTLRNTVKYLAKEPPKLLDCNPNSKTPGVI